MQGDSASRFYYIHLHTNAGMACKYSQGHPNRDSREAQNDSQ